MPQSFFVAAVCLFLTAVAAADHPNIVLIMSDDQGYGDFGATGNRLIETPNIDAMAQRSATMTTFYVSPVCSPTRACLMTGRYNHRTRVIDTFLGRSMMEPDELTIAEILRDSGYATGIFGKWHLGDAYPLRPNDQGFSEALVHKGGGLAQASEPLENQRRYTDAILFRNGQQVQTKGFCTDVYFDAALEFIEQQKSVSKPFFVYLPTNAPHSPYHDVPQELYEHYVAKKDLSSLSVTDVPKVNQGAVDHDTLARICAMITNIDQNVGRLFETLDELDVTENTIVIYMTDNGPNSTRYVGEFRGKKNNVHEGGVRSPFWMHWPAKLKAGSRSDRPSAHIDILPTLVEASGAKLPDGHRIDGTSFLPLLTGEQSTWPNRFLVLQAHRGNQPTRYHHFMIRDDRWKLLHASGFGRESFDGEPAFELYDLSRDKGEANNLLTREPEQFARLKSAYDNWLDDVSSTRPNNYAPPRIHVGTKFENPVILSRQDWRINKPREVGHWKLFAEPGRYSARAVFRNAPGAGMVELEAGDTRIGRTIDAKATSVSFADIELPQGEVGLKVVFSGSRKPEGPYQVFLGRVE